jgi:hypothetical protein
VTSQRREPVFLETDHYRIEGKLTLPSEGFRSRLSDYVNQGDRDFLLGRGRVGHADRRRRRAAADRLHARGPRHLRLVLPLSSGD